MPVAAPLAAVGGFLGSTGGLTAATIGTGVVGSVMASNAAKSAAKTQANAAQQATDTQLQMYGQTRDDLSPYRALGSTAGSAYARLLGINDNQPGSYGGGPVAGTPDWNAYLSANPDVAARAASLTPAELAAGGWSSPQEWAAFQYQNTGRAEGRALPTYAAQPASTTGAPVIDSRQAALEATPGYQFARTQGIQAAERSIGTRGLTGALAKGIGRFVTGLADQTYGANVDRLRDATTIGANAAAGGGQIGAQTGANVANTITGAGQATASGQVGSANAISQGLASIPNALLTNKILGGSGGIYGGGKTSSTGNLKAA